MDPIIKFPDGQSMLLSAIEHDRASRIKYLSPYKGNSGNVLCLCRKEGVPIGVGHRRVPVETFYFYPLHRTDPARHAMGCPHRETAQRCNATPDSPPVIEVNDDGKIIVNLASPSYRLNTDRGRDEPSPEREDAGPSQGKAYRGKLLSLLEVLWTQAELNVWRPWFAGRRNYAVVRARLLEAAAQVNVRRHALAPVLYIPPPFRQDRKAAIQAELDAFLGRLAEQADGKQFYGYVAGLLKAVEQTDRGSVAFRLGHSALRLWMTAEAWQRANERWFHGTGVTRTEERPMAMLARIERREGRKGPWLGVEDIAVLELADTDNWIPVDSDYERQLVDKLVTGKRQFRKPLAVEIGEDELLPDFVLEDRADRTCLEVLGMMSKPEYAAHAEDKRARYQALGQAVWWWNCGTQPAVPPLPTADGAGSHRGM